MTLKLNGSSSGSVSIDAPASTTGGADLTYTLPDATTGGVIRTTTTPGAILQVTQAVKRDTQSIDNTGFPSTITAITGLQPSLTPGSSSNKILVSWSIMLGGGSNTHTDLIVSRSVGGSDTDNILIGDASSSRERSTQHTYIAGVHEQLLFSGQFLDSPSTTSAVTYKIKFRTNDSTIYVNRSATNTDANWSGMTTSTVTLMEVAG